MVMVSCVSKVWLPTMKLTGTWFHILFVPKYSTLASESYFGLMITSWFDPLLTTG